MLHALNASAKTTPFTVYCIMTMMMMMIAIMVWWWRGGGAQQPSSPRPQGISSAFDRDGQHDDHAWLQPSAAPSQHRLRPRRKPVAYLAPRAK
jgi:hypothetical protein